MGDINNNENDLTQLSRGPYSKYSRFAGVESYRKRRRQSKVFQVVVYVLLIMVVGTATFLLGWRLLDDRPITGAGYIEQEDEVVEEEPEPEETPALPATEIKLLMTGDVVMNHAVVESGLKESGAYGFDHLFSNLRGELSSFDLRLVGQETGLAGSKFGFGAWMPLNAPQELGRAEVSAGFNVILRASDHTLDNGNEGVHNELAWWQSEYPNLPLLGVAEPDPAANPGLNDYVNNVYIYEKEGLKIAVLNHSWAIPEESYGVVSPLTEDKIVADVNKAREAGAQIIIACPHWGAEDEVEPTEEEKSFAQIYANNGVDVVIGTHPRVLQRTEVLEGPDGHKTACYYSLGCLVSSLYSQNFLGGLAEVTIARNEEGVCSVKSAVLKPVVTHRGNGEDYSVYLLSAYTDDLTNSSWDSDLTPAEATRRCTEVLGEGYDAEKFELRVL
jgi:poly-gamma-glutamate synthesis protein (capsule biosynthesis protein)